jgi:putative heme-binding domain-containing protein
MRPDADRYLVAAAISSISPKNVTEVAKAAVRVSKLYPPNPEFVAAILRTAIGAKQPQAIDEMLTALTATADAQPPAPWQLQALAAFIEAADEAKLTIDRDKVNAAIARARKLAADDSAPLATRAAAIPLLARDPQSRADDLASVGDKSPQGLLVAILDPNRVVEPRFVNYIATTTDDQTHTGLLASESATAITLLGPEAKAEEIRRQDLKDLRSSNSSLMPDGLEAGMTAQDLADLMVYVRAGK